MKWKQFKIVFFLVIFLVLSLGFNCFLMLSSLKKNNLKNYFSLTDTIGKRIVSHIETGLIFGKELDRFYGLKDILNNNINRWWFIKNLYVIDKEKRIITGIKKINKYEYKYILNKAQNNLHAISLADKNIYLSVLPILKNKDLKGYLIISLNKKINNINIEIIHYQIIIICTIVFISFILLNIFINKVLKLRIDNIVDDIEKTKRNIAFIVSLIIISSQIIYACITTYQCQNRLMSTISKKINYIHIGLVRDFQYLLDKGVSLSHLKGIDKYLHNILIMNPEVGSISILNPEHDTIYETRPFTHEFNWNSILKTLTISCSTPLYNRQKKSVLYINTSGNPEFVLNQVLGMYLDSITVLVLCFVFLGQLNYIFIPALIRYLDIYSHVAMDSSYEKQRMKKRLLRFLRLAAFLFFFGYDMPLSFIPLYIQKFPPISSVIAKDIWLSLPITIEMLFATMSTIVGGGLSYSWGWRRVFFWGFILGGLGLVIVPIFPGPIFYLFSRSIAGIGFGLLLISLQSSVVQEMPEDRAYGIANIFSGALAGSLCGNVVGAMLAERWRFTIVFLLASVIIFLGLIFLYIIFRKSIVTLKRQTSRKYIKDGDKVSLKMFVSDIRIMGVLLFIAVPVAISLVGILYYLTPLYLKGRGIRQGTIGRVLMIYGLCIIYLGPVFSRLVDRIQNKISLVIFTGVISILAFLPFVLWEGIWPVILAVFLVGVANACGSSSLIVYYLDLTKNISLSDDKKISLFRTLERMGQILGPLIFGFFITISGLRNGMFHLLLVFLGLFIFFLILGLLNIKNYIKS